MRMCARISGYLPQGGKESSMKALIIFLVLLAVTFSSGCSSIAVNYDYDPQVDFSSLKTYNWRPFPSSDPAGELVAKHVRNAVDTQLAAKGIAKVSLDPDFLIAPYLGKQFKREVVNWDYSQHSRWRYGGPRYEVYEYEEGTIILDFIDAQAKELIWRGSATAVVEPELTPEQRHKKINTAVAKLLENFPPAKSQ